MKKLIVALSLIVFASCQHHSGEMWVSSYSSIYQGRTKNMCEYFIADNHGDDISVVDTCGKFDVGDVISICKTYKKDTTKNDSLKSK